MTSQPELHSPDSQLPIFWQPDAVKAFTDMCQAEGLNPVRMRKLVDRYVGTQKRPSRQELIEALKHRPRIQERATILSSVTSRLNTFIETFHIEIPKSSTPDSQM